MTEKTAFGGGNGPPAGRPNILYLVHRLPYPPDKGCRIRAFHLLRYLARHADVHLACLADGPVKPEGMAALERYCRRVTVVPAGRLSRWARALFSLARGRTVSEGAFSSPALRGVVRRWARETPFHACLASASSMVPYLRLDALRGTPAVVDLVDVDSQKWLEYAETRRGLRSWLYATEARRLRRLEQDLLHWARAVTLVSTAEADIYRRFAGPGPVHAVTNGVDLVYFQPRPDPVAPASCVFVGQLDYLPNVEGVAWFCREVWPAVRRARPGARLQLVGRNPTPAVERLAETPGVEVVGEVPDVRPYLSRAAVTVAPLQIARGVQNKVLEALAMARPTVASPQALTGLRTRPGTHVLEASTPREWVDHLLGLFDGPDRRDQLGAAGRGYVEEFHQWDRCLEPFGGLLGLPAAGRADDGPRSDAELEVQGSTVPSGRGPI